MKMKACIFNSAGNVTVEEREVEKCGDNDAILRNLVSSVCGSDVSAYKHGGRAYRIADGGEFGHELVGKIAELGKNVAELEIGQRVFPYPVLCAPNNAKACALGGFSEYIHVANAKNGFNLFPIDPTITDEEAALIEPLSVGWRAAMRCKPEVGQNAVVWGAGGIGAAAAMCLKAQGLNKIMVVGRGLAKLQVVEALGFDTVSTEEENWREKIKEYFGSSPNMFGQGVNAQIMVDAVGTEALVGEMIMMMPRRSTLCIVALYSKLVPLNFMALSFGELNVIGSGGQLPEDIIGVMDMLKSKRFDIGKIISSVYRQEDIVAAINAAADSRSTKVCIDFR